MFLKTKKNKQVSKFSLAVISADCYHLWWLLSHIHRFHLFRWTIFPDIDRFYQSWLLTAILSASICPSCNHQSWLLPSVLTVSNSDHICLFQLLQYHLYWMGATTYPDRFYYVCWPVPAMLTASICPDCYHLSWPLPSIPTATAKPDSFPLSWQLYHLSWLGSSKSNTTVTTYIDCFSLFWLLPHILTAYICPDFYYCTYPDRFLLSWLLLPILTAPSVLTDRTYVGRFHVSWLLYQLYHFHLSWLIQHTYVDCFYLSLLLHQLS
jgi:hypothetical protein